MSSQITTYNPNDPFQVFAQPVSLQILSYLTTQELNRCSLVSKLWNKFSNSDIFWKSIALSKFPAMGDGFDYDKTEFKTLKQVISQRTLDSEEELVDQVKKFFKNSSLHNTHGFICVQPHLVQPFCILTVTSRPEEITQYPSMGMVWFQSEKLCQRIMNESGQKIFGRSIKSFWRSIQRKYTLKTNLRLVNNDFSRRQNPQDYYSQAYTIDIYRKNTQSCLVAGNIVSPVDKTQLRLLDEGDSYNDFSFDDKGLATLHAVIRQRTVITEVFEQELLKMAIEKDNASTAIVKTKQSALNKTLAVLRWTIITPFVHFISARRQTKVIVLGASVAAVTAAYYFKKFAK